MSARRSPPRDETETREREGPRLEEYLDLLPDAVLVAGPGGRIEYANDRLAALFRGTREELVGRSIEELVPEALRERHRALREQYAQAPRDRPMGSGLQIVALRLDGTRFLADIELRPRQTRSGTVTIAAVRDRREAGGERNVLVALDDSEAAERVLAEGVALARAYRGELRLLHVAAPDPSFVGYEAGPQPVRDQRARELREEHRTLLETAEALREEGLDAQAMLVEGMTAETILSEAERCGSDVIVMGSHGRGALARTLLGSVSQEVVRRSDRPVVVVPVRAEPD